MSMKRSKRSTDMRQSNVSFNTPMKLLMQRRAAALAAKVKVPIPERQTYKVLLDGLDVTPKTLIPPTVKHTEDAPAVPTLPTTDITSASALHLTKNIFNTQLHQQTVMGESTFGFGTMGTAAQSLTVARMGGKRYESDGDIINPDVLQSTFLLPLAPNENLPSTINLTLVETPMIYLFEKVSSVIEKDSTEAPAVEKANEFYVYITKGKGRNRKVLNAEAQTNDSVLKSRSTKPTPRQRRHVESFASGWDMLDTIKKMEDAKKHVEVIEEEDLSPEVQEKKLKNALSNTNEEVAKEENDEKTQMKKLCKMTSFQNAVMIMERILDTNYFKIQQTRVRGLIQPDPFRTEIDYNYRLELLWKFSNDDCYDRPILSACWNPFNPDIVAVGYGKFYFSEKKHGLVCVWNIKNPTQPERLYRFLIPVTSLFFSQVHPNLLGVCFYDGTVKIINIIETEVKLIAGTTRFTTFTHEPLWGLRWIANKNQYTNKIEESVIVAGREGIVCQYKQGKTSDLLGVVLMNVARKSGEIRGIKTMRTCEVNPLPVALSPSITCLCLVPYDTSLYYIGTDEGTIYKGSKYYLNQHIEIFLAHNGPVNIITYSPFCNRIFLTSGADWSIRIWAEGIFEPLVTLQVPLISVDRAAWSPSISTVIVGVCGNEIYMWDIRKKSYLPASITKSPSDARITIVSFTKSGRNLLVGDVEGNLNFYILEEMPFPPFYQANVLTHAIKKVLVVRPDLLKLLKKIGKLNVPSKNPKLLGEDEDKEKEKDEEDD